MAKITNLTDEQQALVDVWRQRWLGFGTCTAPADRPRAEAAICEMYAFIGEAKPTFIWCQSPATASLAIALLKSSDSRALGASLRASLWASLGASLGDSLRASLRASLGDSLRDSLFWGQHEVTWIAFYRYCTEVLGVKYTQKSLSALHLWSEIGESCCWWWPYRGTVIASDRPRVVRMESNPQRSDALRLHCSDGPALLFRDSWPVYSWHGVRVTQQIIEAPHMLTAKQITEERNAEVRRVMIERFGQERYIREAGAKIVHRDDWGTLWRADLPGDEPLVMVEVVNSTPEPDGSYKNYMLRVPPTILRAHQALAWTFGCTEHDYILAQQS